MGDARPGDQQVSLKIGTQADAREHRRARRVQAELGWSAV